MKWTLKIARRKESLGIALGLLAAFAILFSQTFYYSYLETANDGVSLDVTDENGEELPVLKMAHEAVASFAQISINQTLDFISEIIISNEVSTNEVPKTLRLDRYFETLFNLIISPNAP
ncbi:MAG: hypothetical protein AAGA02_06860 [Bacteroidota bacterium]